MWLFIYLSLSWLHRMISCSTLSIRVCLFPLHCLGVYSKCLAENRDRGLQRVVWLSNKETRNTRHHPRGWVRCWVGHPDEETLVGFLRLWTIVDSLEARRCCGCSGVWTLVTWIWTLAQSFLGKSHAFPELQLFFHRSQQVEVINAPSKNYSLQVIAKGGT